MSDTTTRNETVTAWAPYIAIIVTVGGAAWGVAWSIGGGLAQIGAQIDTVEAKIDAVEAKIEANAEAIRVVVDAVEVNRQAIAANSAKIEHLDGRLDEHGNVHAEHERRHELAAAPAAR